MNSHKSRRKFIVLALIILLLAGYVGFALSRPTPALTISLAPAKAQPAQTVSLPWPSYGESAVGAVGYGVLATDGTQTPIPTASTIKILTALAVLQQYPLATGQQGPMITITQADVDSYNKYIAEDGSVVRVSAGEQISEYQALQALLLPSANNMAETLARWSYGSLDAYNTAANQLAVKLGMTHTTVTDPSGFLPSTVSTAQDLTILGEAALKNSTLAVIVAQDSAVIPVQGSIENVNQFLGRDGIVGIKTGNNDQDTGAFLFAATHLVSGRTITVVGAIMNAQDLGTAMYDALPVIESADDNFALSTLVHQNTVVGSYHVPWLSKSISIVAQKDVSVLSWNGSQLTSSVSLHKESYPLADGTTVGEITVQNGLDNTQTHVPAVLSAPITKPSLMWRLLHP